MPVFESAGVECGARLLLANLTVVQEFCERYESQEADEQRRLPIRKIFFENKKGGLPRRRVRCYSYK